MTRRLDDGLADARVLVTGAAGGIGAAVASAFVAAGAQVVASDRRPIGDLAGLRGSFSTDIQDLRAIQQLIDDTVELLGGIDVVAHMAGILVRRDDLDAVTEDDWDLQHSINLKASFFLLRAAANRMVDQGTGGRLIATTSQAWWTGGFGGSAAYAASKGGLVSLCRSLARTYGAARITMNTVAPGAIDTAMLTTDLPPDALASTIANTPLQRLGRPEEVADAVLFLASARASFITGTTLNVSGGWLVY
ncbi:SDR family NAD(P)-dependent oxidoreductase [Kribbella sp. NPDC050124]|uniref:SDR family NAD(P)-dependent oxidoreductase n=1 Tax=Kribbella sp. NPDC050124 TaxID=3364114 RepID=UPI003795AC59